MPCDVKSVWGIQEVDEEWCILFRLTAVYKVRKEAIHYDH